MRYAQGQGIGRWTPVFHGRKCKLLLQRDVHMERGGELCFLLQSVVVIRGQGLFFKL